MTRTPGDGATLLLGCYQRPGKVIANVEKNKNTSIALADDRKD